MKLKNILKKVGSALCGVLIALEILVIAFLVISRMSGGVPSLFGYNVYVIVSPSMTPELEVGDVIVSRVYRGDGLEVGDVVQYVAKSGVIRGEIITHKIISISEEDGTVVTKGVANSQPDAPIREEDVLAVMTYKAVILDDVYAVVNHPAGFILLVILPMAAMIVAEMVNLAREIHEEKQRMKKEETAHDTSEQDTQ